VVSSTISISVSDCASPLSDNSDVNFVRALR
jgi:hypothetical protein